MITRCYLEITNVCNLSCVFCPKTERAKHTLTLDEFDALTSQLEGKVKFLYFHLMGEPFLHPLLPQFVLMARHKGFVPIITTNGTLLSRRADFLDALPHNSLEAARRGCVVVLRLWNEGGHNRQNDDILNLLALHVPRPWTERHDGWRLADNLYIENDNMFEWPDLQHATYDEQEVFCYALRNQIGVLVDGTVVPCCLDHNGDIALGNLFRQSLADILASPRARALYDGFTSHNAVESLCQRCGYSAVSKRFRK